MSPRPAVNGRAGRYVTDADVRGLSIVFGDGAGTPKWPQDVRSQFKTLCGRDRRRERLDTP